MEKPKDGINKTAVLVALILGLSVVGYGYLNISYKNKVFEAEQVEKKQKRLDENAEKEAAKVEAEERAKEEALKRNLLDVCLSAADEGYTEVWNKACKERGLAEECSLPISLAESIDDTHNSQKDDCFRKYPVD